MFPGRTTEEAVRKLAETDEEFDVEQFIDSANELVTEVCGSVGYTDHRLELIERYLACHFYDALDRKPRRERVGPLTTETEGEMKLGFDNTRYGQDAMRLDTAGGLARLNQQMISGKGNLTARIKWGGTRNCDVPSTWLN